MIAIRQAIQNQLTGDVAIEALVEDRIYPRQARQGDELPLVTWRLDMEAAAQAHDKRHGGDRYRLEVEAIGIGMSATAGVAAAVERALDHFSDGVIAACLKVGETDLDAAIPEGAANPVKQINQTFTIYTVV